jgi:hypothetical protein
MLPKSVLHKKNGHARPPVTTPTAGAAMLLEVHGARSLDAPRIGADLLRFTHLIRTERTALLFAQAAQAIDGLRAAMAEALARTRQDLDAGHLDDVRTMLERLREDADRVAHLVDLVAAAAESDVGERRVLDIEDVIDRILEQPALRPPGLTVVRRRTVDLPPVAGHARQLRRLLLALLVAADRRVAGAVAIETSVRDGGMQGERIVRIRVVDQRRRCPPGIPELRLAGGIARSHGGSLTVEHARDHHIFVLDLPAL